VTDIHDAPGRRLARTGRIATKAAIALTAAAVVTPMSVFGDNGTSLQDLWATFDQAVFAGMATPVLIWAANKVRPPEPEPPYLPPPPPSKYPDPPPRWDTKEDHDRFRPSSDEHPHGMGGDPRR
jgi:hypothetical protein